MCVCLYSWCMCHYQVGIMQYLEHNLAKCATIVELTRQLFHRPVTFFQCFQHLTGFLHHLCRFG